MFRGTEVVSRNLLTTNQLRSSAWIRIRHDVYADARLDQDHRLACQATALRLPTGAAIAGPSAAYLYGVEHAATYRDDVHVITPPHRRMEPQQGIRVHHAQLAPGDLVVVGDTPRTTPPRTAWDVACWLDLASAVAVIDGMLRTGVVDPTRMLAFARSQAGKRGGRRAARAFHLADGRSQSPPESLLRIRLVLAGLPRPVAQHPITLPDGSVYHPDLAWPEYRVAMEYDGHWHSDPEQLHRDRRRLNRLVAAGWIVLHVTSRRLYREFPGIVRETTRALRSRGWRGARTS